MRVAVARMQVPDKILDRWRSFLRLKRTFCWRGDLKEIPILASISLYSERYDRIMFIHIVKSRDQITTQNSDHLTLFFRDGNKAFANQLYETIL